MWFSGQGKSLALLHNHFPSYDQMFLLSRNFRMNKVKSSFSVTALPSCKHCVYGLTLPKNSASSDQPEGKILLFSLVMQLVCTGKAEEGLMNYFMYVWEPGSVSS